MIMPEITLNFNGNAIERVSKVEGEFLKGELMLEWQVKVVENVGDSEFEGGH